MRDYLKLLFFVVLMVGFITYNLGKLWMTKDTHNIVNNIVILSLLVIVVILFYTLENNSKK